MYIYIYVYVCRVHGLRVASFDVDPWDVFLGFQAHQLNKVGSDISKQ